MLSGKAPVIITESKENVVDPAAEIEKRKRLAEEELEARQRLTEEVNSSKEIAMRQRLAEAERDLAESLRAHTPTTDESNLTSTNDTTTESTTVDALGKGR